jgi:hypothetical protein
MPLDPDAPLLLADLPARAGLALTAAGPGGTVVPCRDCPDRQAVYCAAGSVALCVPLTIHYQRRHCHYRSAIDLQKLLWRWGYERVEMRRADG